MERRSHARLLAVRPVMARLPAPFVLLVLIIGLPAFLLWAEPAEPEHELLESLRSAGPAGAVPLLERSPTSRALTGGLAFVQELLRSNGTDDGLELLEYLGKRAEAAAPQQEGAELLELLAVVRYRQGRSREAIRLLTRAGDDYAELLLHGNELSARRLLASLQHGYGVLESGLRTMHRVLELEEFFDRDIDLASALSEAAMISYKLGRLEAVPELLDRAHTIFEAEQDDDGLGTVLRTYGNYYIGTGQLERALATYEEAATYYERTNNLHDYANTSFNIGLTYLNLGRPLIAVGYLENAISNFVGAGSRSGAGMAGTELARVLLTLGNLGEAERVIQISIRNLRDSQSLRRLAGAYLVEGFVHAAQGSREKATDSWRNSLRLYRDLGLESEQAQVERILEQAEQELAEERSL